MSRAEQRGSGRGRVWAARVGLAAVLLAVLAVGAHSTPYFPIDLALTLKLQGWQSPALDAFALAVDWIGYVPQIAIAVGLGAVMLWLAGRRWEGVLLCAALAAEGTITQIIKQLVQRPRPAVPEIRVYQPHADYTFPSGHVFCYVVIFGLLAYYAYRLLRPSAWRTALIVALVALIVLAGPVRVYLGEHWPSDVLAGYLLGVMGMIGLVPLYDWGHWRWGSDFTIGEKASQKARPA